MLTHDKRSQSSIFYSCDKALPVFEQEQKGKKEQSQDKKWHSFQVYACRPGYLKDT